MIKKVTITLAGEDIDYRAYIFEGDEAKAVAEIDRYLKNHNVGGGQYTFTSLEDAAAVNAVLAEESDDPLNLESSMVVEDGEEDLLIEIQECFPEHHWGDGILKAMCRELGIHTIA